MTYSEYYLAHHGVKGMKWGKRRWQNKDGSLTPAGEKRYAKIEKQITKKYTKAGQLQGEADYYKKTGDAAYKKHDENARVFDKAAKQYESRGQLFRAEASRKAAAALRARGENIKAKNYEKAESYTKAIAKSTQKASKFADKKGVDLGKKKVSAILDAAKKQGFDREARYQSSEREAAISERLGDRGTSALNFIRGR